MPVPPVETISEALRPLTDRPEEAAVLCDIDGTLAPIVERAEEATVPEATSRLLGRIARRYRVVACISGRGSTEARRIVAPTRHSRGPERVASEQLAWRPDAATTRAFVDSGDGGRLRPSCSWR